MSTRVLALILALSASAAQADCYADYKAKKDGPLRLHYGIVRLPEALCDDAGAARREVAERIAAGGWQLLSVEGIFREDGLDRREESAGEYFLRY